MTNPIRPRPAPMEVEDPERGGSKGPPEPSIEEKALNFFMSGSALSVIAGVAMVALGVLAYMYIMPNMLHIDVTSGTLGFASGMGAAVVPGLLMVGGIFAIGCAVLKHYDKDKKFAVIIELTKHIFRILAAIGMVVVGSIIFAQTLQNHQFSYGPNLLSLAMAGGGLIHLLGYVFA